MDCNAAKEYMNIFDSLSQKEKDSVLLHAQSCEQCKSELIKSAKLRELLADLEELEAPKGLALSAIEKAKKKTRIPVFAYVSVAAAAVLAVAFFATSGLLVPRKNAADEAAGVQMAEDNAVRGDSFVSSEMAEAGAADADMAEAPMIMQDDSVEESNDLGAEKTAGEMCYIYVNADQTDFAQAIEVFLKEKEIYTDRYDTASGGETIMFVVGELNFDEFMSILTEHEIVYEGTVLPGTLIQLTIE